VLMGRTPKCYLVFLWLLSAFTCFAPNPVVKLIVHLPPTASLADNRIVFTSEAYCAEDGYVTVYNELV
jgi:hypothetical protein